MFNLTDDVVDSFDTLPEGSYLVVAKAGELKSTKAGDGKYIKVELEVIDGQYKGRKLWNMFNVQNPNEVAVKIGRAQMKKFFLAAGAKPEHLANLTPESFAGKVVVAVVTTEIDSYGEKNVIKDWRTEKGEKVKTDSTPKTAQAKPTATTTKAAF
jgi:hypothetical protein